MEKKLNIFNVSIKELSKKERIETYGGNPWIWVGIGYIVGEILDGIQEGLDRAENCEIQC